MWEEFLLQYFKFHFQYLYLDWSEEIISLPIDNFRCSIFCSWKPEIKKNLKMAMWSVLWFESDLCICWTQHESNSTTAVLFSIIYTLRSSSMSLLNFWLNQWQNNWWVMITNSSNILFLHELQMHLIGGAEDSFFGLNHLIKMLHQNTIQLFDIF